MAIEATPGSATANSYITLVDADLYFDTRLNTEAWEDSPLQEEALLQACFRLGQYDYVGKRVSILQALDWPRTIEGITQVETATVVGTITGTGDATVIITAAGMTGSPITLNVPVVNLDTATAVATKIRTALNANAVIAALFTIGGSGAEITLASKPILSSDEETFEAVGNDSTLNISINNGTCTGLTPALTSANTTAGVSGDLIRNYPTNVIPAPMKYAQCELALALLIVGSESVAAGAVESLRIGSSVEVKYWSGSSAVDTTTDYTSLPIAAARYLKGLRLVNVLA